MAEFCTEKIKEYLTVNVPEIIIKESIDSTNTYLKNNSHKYPENTVVIAKTQTSGRGRTGNSFFSPSGGLYMSVLIKPRLDLKNIGFITAFAAVAVCRAVSKVCGKKAEIKWVNDIYLDNKKICGILTESTPHQNIVLGIGLNIIPPKDDFPDEIKNKAGALFDFLPDENIKNIITAEILNSLFEVLYSDNSSLYIKEYKELSLLTNKTVIYKRNNEEYQGEVLGINDNLHLIVKNADKNTVTLSAGEIKIKDWE